MTMPIVGAILSIDDDDGAFGIAVATNGSVFLAGETGSTEFPVLAPFQRALDQTPQAPPGRAAPFPAWWTGACPP